MTLSYLPLVLEVVGWINPWIKPRLIRLRSRIITLSLSNLPLVLEVVGLLKCRLKLIRLLRLWLFLQSILWITNILKTFVQQLFLLSELFSWVKLKFRHFMSQVSLYSLLLSLPSVWFLAGNLVL